MKNTRALFQKESSNENISLVAGLPLTENTFKLISFYFWSEMYKQEMGIKLYCIYFLYKEIKIMSAKMCVRVENVCTIYLKKDRYIHFSSSQTNYTDFAQFMCSL